MAKETSAWGTCHSCAKGVAVKVNVSGKAYYGCDHCGFKGQHTWQKTSDAYLQQFNPAPPEPAADKPASTTGTAPAKTPTPSKSPRNAGTVLG